MDAFIGEIKAFPYNFVPVNWLPCDGTLYPVGQYQALASVIGPRYGGSGTQFAVPDLRGRVAVGVGSDFPQVALKGGAEGVVLNSNQMPSHNHEVTVYLHSQSQANLISNTPGSEYYLTNGSTKLPDSTGKSIPISSYSSTIDSPETLHNSSIGASGGTKSSTCSPHENRQPYLAFRYCICYDSDYYPVNSSI
jgi:microcystin-dependent protein